MSAAVFGPQVSDAARRAADAVNDALYAGYALHWVAIRLSDGGTDGHIYEHRADAVKFQMHETQCMYLCVPPMPAGAAEMEQLLATHRRMYDAGFRMIDPEGAGS